MSSTFCTYFCWLFWSSLFLIQSTHAAVQCTSGDCVIDCDLVDCSTVTCTQTATSCTVLCGRNDCSNSEMYLAAKQFNQVTCDGNDACKNADIYCGIPNDHDIPNGFNVNDFDGKIQRCTFYISNNAMPDRGYIRCFHKIKLCELYATTNSDAFKVSQFECELSLHDAICSMNCDSSKSCGSGTSNFNCYSPNCECNNCNGLSTSTNTAPPSTWMLGFPTSNPTTDPTSIPTTDPTDDPTTDPTLDPTEDPTEDPTSDPTIDPTTDPTDDPTTDPTIDPTIDPTEHPTSDPTTEPTTDPSFEPTMDPTTDPSYDPTIVPTSTPTMDPTTNPTLQPTVNPTIYPTVQPTANPTDNPTLPTIAPTMDPTTEPTVPTNEPTLDPTMEPILSTMTVADVPDHSKHNGLLSIDNLLWVLTAITLFICVSLLICASIKAHRVQRSKKQFLDMEVTKVRLQSASSAAGLYDNHSVNSPSSYAMQSPSPMPVQSPLTALTQHYDDNDQIRVSVEDDDHLNDDRRDSGLSEMTTMTLQTVVSSVAPAAPNDEDKIKKMKKIKPPKVPREGYKKHETDHPKYKKKIVHETFGKGVVIEPFSNLRNNRLDDIVIGGKHETFGNVDDDDKHLDDAHSDILSDGVSLIDDIDSIDRHETFGQIIGDNAFSQELIVEDIVNDMDNVDDNKFVTPM